MINIKLHNILGYYFIESRKYKAFMGNAIYDLLTYPVMLSIYAVLWSTIEKNALYAFSYKDMILYYSLALLVAKLCNDRTISNLVEDAVFKGELSIYLVRPVHILDEIIGKTLFNASIYSIYLTVLLIILRMHFIAFTMIQLLGFILMLVFGLILSIMFYFSFSLLAFRFEQIWVVRMLTASIITFFSGALVPLYVFPKSLQFAFSKLPFQFFVYKPITYILSPISYTQLIFDIITAIVWMLLFCSVIHFGWKRGMERFEAMGI